MQDNWLMVAECLARSVLLGLAQYESSDENMDNPPGLPGKENSLKAEEPILHGIFYNSGENVPSGLPEREAELDCLKLELLPDTAFSNSMRAAMEEFITANEERSRVPSVGDQTCTRCGRKYTDGAKKQCDICISRDEILRFLVQWLQPVKLTENVIAVSHTIFSNVLLSLTSTESRSEARRVLERR